MSEEPAINKRLRNQITNACEEFSLVEEGDKIMVGLSGGKDSLTLVNFLSEMAEKMENKFKVIAAHIKFTNLPYGIDAEYLEKFCADRKVEYHLIEDAIRDGHVGNGTCVHCSRYRRAKLMEMCRVFGCNKLALGHHLDDIVATLLMSMTHHGRFSGMACKLTITVGESNYPLTLIRPLSYTPENDIIQFCKENEYQPAKCRCPWGDTGTRSKTRQAVDMIVAGLGEEARRNIFKSQFHIAHRDCVPTPESNDIEDVKVPKKGNQKPKKQEEVPPKEE